MAHHELSKKVRLAYSHILSLFKTRPATVPMPFFEWEYIPEGWDYANTHPEVRGWDTEDIAEIYAKKWPIFERWTRGTGPLGFSHESEMSSRIDLVSHNLTMSFAYILCRAAYNKKRISILDWGGGIGHYFLLAKALLPELEIEYHCKDVPVLCKLGAKLIPSGSFHVDEKTILSRKYDLVMASTSIQYATNWQEIVSDLVRVTNRYLYIARLPVVQENDSFVVIQRPYSYGYNTEYLCWYINEKQFMKNLTSLGMKLLREFVTGDKIDVIKAPEQGEYKGYLFVPRC